MRTKHKIVGTFFILLPLLLFNCYKFVLKPNIPPQSTADEWPQFGANPARTGNPQTTIDPPLELAWTYSANAAIESALILADSVLYFGSMDGYIYALDIIEGKKLGRKKFRIAATCAHKNHHLIIARRYGKKTLYNYDLANGKERWSIDAGDIQSEPLLDREWIYISALYKHVDRYNFETGNKSWTFKTKSQLHSSPALSQKTLVFGSDDGTIYALHSETGEQQWTFQANGSVYATPVISKNTVFVGSFDNNLYALDLASGNLKWKFSTEASIYHACAVNQKYVIAGSNDHFIYCLDVDRGMLQWKFAAKSLISTTPILTRTHVFFGSTDKHFYGVNLSTGKLAWKYEAEGRIRTTPIVYKNYLLGASENNVIYAFNPTLSDSANQELD